MYFTSLLILLPWVFSDVTQHLYCQVFLQNEKHKSVTNSKVVENVRIA